ncbi:hypothetical protein [Spirosoma fluviale]|uniref:Trypsin-co-occurring domain-containing protein n=1 Tax=Spirosoma fluviale TaxID=1597977 RepID=A0A286GW33_9BACT|nr:hypothetical protein [Spirosoma fluviale]SOD99755.1 hypothetical protein SAMN06269250_0147 [Spirosoma fluviale]
MKGIYEQFGDINVYVAPTSEISESNEVKLDEKKGGIKASTTSAGHSTEFRVGLKKAVGEIIRSFGKELNEYIDESSPNELEIEISISLSAGGWIIGVQTEGTAKVTMKWKKS